MLLGYGSRTSRAGVSSTLFCEIPCSACPKTYIGETGRVFGTRLLEHKKELMFLSFVLTSETALSHDIDDTIIIQLQLGSGFLDVGVSFLTDCAQSSEGHYIDVAPVSI